MRIRIGKKEYILETIGTRHTVMRVYRQSGKFRLIGEYVTKAEAMAAVLLDCADEITDR